MATHRAIAALSRAILGLLKEGYPESDSAGAEVRLYQAKDFEAPMSEGFSLFLYHVTVNMTLRNPPLRRSPDQRRFRPSLPLDLHYLLTPWAADAEKQLRMLGWAVRFLEDNASVPAGVINKYGNAPDAFQPGDAIELACESLTLPDFLGLWDKLKPRMQTSITYVARSIQIDSEVALSDSPAVKG